MTETLLALYFAALLSTLLFKSQVVKSQWLFLLRAFFPNWKFFDVVGHVPHLMARAAQDDAAGELVWTDWFLIYPRQTRRWWHLFHNADTNIKIGRQTLVNHFWSDLNELPDGDDPRHLVTYTLIERLVQAQLQERHGPYSHWQFELHMVLDGPQGVRDSYTMLQSPVCAC
ncbi:MAG: hypothetical protein WCJ64_08560 [Rhodospirillaceae bacterium]